jgi:replicative DNA helicase
VAIAAAIQALTERDAPVTSMTVLEQLRAVGALVRSGGGAYLLELDTLRASTGEDEYLTDVLEVAMIRRQATVIGNRFLQRLSNPETSPEEAVHATTDELTKIGSPQAEIETHGWPDGEFDPEPDWVIPGLLAADERVMLTGGEGLGKSMLIRQLVASVAIGRDPFSFNAFDPAPALHVDLENPRSVSDAAYRHIRNGLRFAKIELPGGTLHRIEPRLFDVEDPRDVSWLLRVVRKLRPRLIAIGPVKNMSSQDLNEERNAVKVHTVLNRVRAESSAALVVEGHAGHSSRGVDGDWRPRGSSSFLGWPEIGLGMKPVPDTAIRSAKLVSWRGARTMGRDWPEHLVAGSPWPWVEDPRLET